MNVRTRGERGSTLPLIIIAAALCFLLIAVVTDLSAAQLRRQSLSSLADGGALRAANLSGMGGSTYTGGFGGPGGTRVPLTDTVAHAAVVTYLDHIGAHRKHPGLRVASVHVDHADQTVTVVLRERYRMPFSVEGVGPSTTIRVSASAALTLDDRH